MALARWQSTIVDEAGDIQAAASVEVRRETAGAPLASIYSDREGATPLGNPMTADSEGFAAFHVAGGAYRITATKGAFSRVWRYVGIGTAGEADTTDITALVQQVDAGYALTFESETSSPPSAGAIRFNNADLSAATEAYISTENLGESNIELRLMELFSASRTVKDTFSISDPDSNTLASWQIDGAALVGSPGDSVTLTISDHAGETSFADDTIVNFQPNRAGADGADGAGDVDGPDGGVTDGHAAVFDGTTGKAIKTAGAAPYVVGGTDVAITDGGTGQSSAAAAFNALKQAATTGATGVVEEATDAEVYASTNAKFLDAGHLTSAAAPPSAITETGGSIAVDWAAFIYDVLTVDENSTIANPSNEAPGTFRHLLLKGNVTSPSTQRTITFGNEFGGDVPSITDLDDTKWYLVTIACIAAGHFIATATNASAP